MDSPRDRTMDRSVWNFVALTRFESPNAIGDAPIQSKLAHGG
jgi:hypothetical protein